MKKLILISALLFSFNGWSDIFANCIDTRKIANHGYREIQKISNSTGESNYNDGCRNGRYLTFSSGEMFECKQEIPVSKGERIVLLSSLLEGIFLNQKKYENGSIPCASKSDIESRLYTNLLPLFRKNSNAFKQPLSFVGSEEYKVSYMLVKENDDETYPLSKPIFRDPHHAIENLFYEDSDKRLIIYSYDTLKKCTPVLSFCLTDPELIILDKDDIEAIRIKKLFRWNL